jgi:hypothetical protein
MPPDDSTALPAPPTWRPVAEPQIVFRFLKESDRDAPGFVENFASDAERGKGLAPGEHPDLLTGMSVFVSEAAARKRWAELRGQALKKRSERNKRRQRRLRMSVGEHIGEVLLGPGHGFEIADEADAEGHLTIRGDKDLLAGRVTDVYPAQTTPT